LAHADEDATHRDADRAELSCHGCSECCRDGLVVTLTPEERLRIEQQRWTAADGVDPQATVVVHGSGFRLGHQSDEACVFLEPAGRCRIHAKFGAEARPLACRLYPLVLHPAGKKLVADLRFSCPSAVANRGKPMSEQDAELQKLAALVVPIGHKESPPRRCLPDRPVSGRIFCGSSNGSTPRWRPKACPRRSS